MSVAAGCRYTSHLDNTWSSTQRRRPSFHVAPMREYTDRHLRRLMRGLSQNVILWSEMEKAGAILGAGENLSRLLCRGSASGVEVLQLGGDDASELAEAVRMSSSFGYDEVNLNCGCPGIETGGSNFGASLMRDPAATARLVEEMVRAAGPDTRVSVKCRVGVVEHAGDATEAEAPPEEVERLYAGLEEFALSCVDAGAAHVVVHARQAVMAGLSPQANRTVPPLRPELAARLSERLSGACSVTLNGGIGCVVDALDALNDAPALAGVQAGRWLIRRPLDLLAVDAAFDGSGKGAGGFE